MPITKDINNKIIYVPKQDLWSSDITGVFSMEDFAVSDNDDPTRQILLDPSAIPTNTAVMIKANAATASNITLTLPSTSGTLVTASGAGAQSIGALDGQVKNANAATISGTVLYMQTGDAMHPGVVPNIGAANGVASLDANGQVPIGQLPPAAIERLVIVADQAARFALTTATVQNGDTVKQNDTNVMYFVVDDTNLGNASGYLIYTAGTASSIAWSGITSIPAPVSALLGTNTGDITLGTPNGLSLSGQAISLTLSTTSVTGALSSADWTTFNNKQNTVTVGALDSQSANAAGLALTSGVLSAQSADTTHPGLINTATQSFSGNKTFTGSIGASNLSGTNTGDVTLGTTSGLSIVGQALSLGVASAGVTGALSGTDWSTFNNKGSGTVTAVSVAAANGLSGNSSGGATPALTLSCTASGVLKGNGSAISGATAGTDYSAGTSGLATGILKSTTSTGALTIAVAGDFPTLNQNTSGSAASLSATLAIGSGGTGQTTANAAFNALSPMTTGGDLIYGGASGVATRLANGTAGKVLTSAGTTLAPTWSSAAAPALVGASYYMSANTTPSANAQVNFDTSIYDTNSAVTTGASWKFTCPVVGYYLITATIEGGSAGTSVFAVYVNGAAYTNLIYYLGAGFGSSPFSGSAVVRLTATSDTIDIRSSASILIVGGNSPKTTRIDISYIGS